MIERKLNGTAPAIPFPKGTTDTQTHMYLPDFPSQPGGPELPPGPLPGPEQYRKVMRWMGLERVIVTQANAHQKDNSNLLACLQEMGDCAWGVAVITPETTRAEIVALAGKRIVGVRIMDLPGGATGLEHLAEIDTLAHDAGWMLAIQFDGSDILDHMPRLERIRSRWVFDHHGKFLRGTTPESPEVEATLRLIDRGNCWFKFSGAYESSIAGLPFCDVEGPSRRIAAHAHERIVWGTNWPHNAVRRSQDYPDEVRLAETVLEWLPQGVRDQILAVNPIELYGLPAVRRQGTMVSQGVL